MAKNITLSISDELAQKMGVMPEVNWSEVCRQAIEQYIGKRGVTTYQCPNCGRTAEVPTSQIPTEYICKNCGSKLVKVSKEKGELLTGLEDYLKWKLAKPEDKESVRRVEIERFAKKWGSPDSIIEDPVPPYVGLQKEQKIKLDDSISYSSALTQYSTLTLQISNSRVLASRIVELDQKGLGKYDIRAYDIKLEPLVDYFKSKGFTIAQHSLTLPEVEMYVTGLNKAAARDLLERGIQHFGLFAADKEDHVFIAYRGFKP